MIGMSMYRYFNPNPVGNITRDCVIRAVSAALDISWDDAFDLVAERAKQMGETMDENAVYGSILRQCGFYRAVISNSCSDCYTARDFCRAIDGRPAADIWPVMDELMSTLRIVQPRLYDGVMRKLA